MRIDLQVHTSGGSADSALSPEELIEGCRELGLDGVGLTEHSSLGLEETVEIVTSAGLVLVPGREVSFGGAHILVFCMDLQLLKQLPGLISPEDAVLKRADVACIWAHPAAAAGSGAYPPFVPSVEGIGEVVHAVEVLNGRHLAFPPTIAAAAKLAGGLKLQTTGGSDAHERVGLGRCYTVVDSDPIHGAKGVIHAIRDGAVRPVLSKAWARVHGYDYRDDLKRFLE